MLPSRDAASPDHAIPDHGSADNIGPDPSTRRSKASGPGSLEPVSTGSSTRGRAADRIRDTAHELFYRQGIRAVGVEEIVQTAGVTKPSLYRAFGSKEALACAYLQDYDSVFWERFEAAAAAHPDDPRAALLLFLRRLGERAEAPDYRGCGLSNAALEHPDREHPARALVLDTKTRLRARLRAMAAAAGAREPERAGDGLLLLIEGVFSSGQIFGPGGPATSLVPVAELLLAPSES